MSACRSSSPPAAPPSGATSRTTRGPRACSSTTSRRPACGAKWLLKAHPDKTKIAEITFNSDFGKSYATGFRFATKGTDIKVVDQQLHDPTAPNLTNQFTTLAASGADVLLLETTGAFCVQAMAEVEKQTTWKPIVIMSGTCAQPGQFFQPLIDQGLTGANTYLIQNYKDVTTRSTQVTTSPSCIRPR